MIADYLFKYKLCVCKYNIYNAYIYKAAAEKENQFREANHHEFYSTCGKGDRKNFKVRATFSHNCMSITFK